MNRITRYAAALLVMALTVPAFAQVTDEDVDRAREEVNALLANSQQLSDDVQAAWALQFSLEKEISDLEASIELAKAQIADSKKKLEEVAVEMYMGSASSATLQILFALTTGEYEAGAEYLRNVSGDEVEIVNQLRSYRAELDRQTERLAEASAEQEAVAEDLAQMSTDLQADLEEAQALYEQLVAQQAAEEAAAAAAATSTTVGPTPETTSGSTPDTSSATTTTAPPATTTTTSSPPPDPSGDGACPIDGATVFSDTFGDPRSGGRTHEGVDMMAAHMTPVVAIYSGSVSLTSGSLSGNAIWLYSDAGDTYFYAHLDSYAVNSGQDVTEGELIGYVGDTGNAPPGVYHLHFEYHPGGGAAVNPYPLVAGLC